MNFKSLPKICFPQQLPNEQCFDVFTGGTDNSVVIEFTKEKGTKIEKYIVEQ